MNQTDSQEDRRLPHTDSAGPRSFCGVMYFKMDPINSRAMGVAADLSHVQLNLRFAPTDPVESDFQDIYGLIVAAVLGEQFEKPAADAALADLNEALQQKDPVA